MEDVMAVLTGMLMHAPNGNGAKEVEIRLGYTLDGVYTSGVAEEAWDRVLARLRSNKHWTGTSSSVVRHIHYDDLIADVDSGAFTSKRREMDAVFSTDVGVSVRVCESIECHQPAVRRKLVETAVRSKHRESFEYKDTVRFDCSLCVTSLVRAATAAEPRCTYEVEIEALSGKVTARAMLLKVDDLVEMIAGSRPTAYTRVTRGR
jgi:hypothetical protein